MGMEKLDSCAVVGNSGAILEGSFGEYIDNHQVVVRTVARAEYLLLSAQHPLGRYTAMRISSPHLKGLRPSQQCARECGVSGPLLHKAAGLLVTA